MTSPDPQDMMGAICGLPEQCDGARRIARDAALPGLSGRTFSSIVLAGLGGSAIGGDLLRATYGAQLKVPMEVVRDYHLPNYVGPQTLVLASSNSGNTEETLSAYDQARTQRATVVAFSTGGELERRARNDGVALVKFPGGLQPRAALGYSFVPPLVVLARIGLLPEMLLDDIDEAIAALRDVRAECGPDRDAGSNQAKRLAASWVGKIPVIYGSQGERGVVAYRWKTQINENAKAYAVANVFPELNHNETVGFSGADGQRIVEAALAVVILRDQSEPERIKRRVELTKQIIGGRAASVDEVWSRGKSALARMLSLVYVGDFASCYLAYAYREDPTPVRVIERLKAELAKA